MPSSTLALKYSIGEWNQAPHVSRSTRPATSSAANRPAASCVNARRAAALRVRSQSQGADDGGLVERIGQPDGLLQPEEAGQDAGPEHVSGAPHVLPPGQVWTEHDPLRLLHVLLMFVRVVEAMGREGDHHAQQDAERD